MRALDTNVLVRIIIDDDPIQCAAAERVLADSIWGGEPLFIAIPVLCELVWMLKDKKFKQPKAHIVHVIQSLVDHDRFQIESRSLVIGALDSYRQGKADFADYLIGQLARKAGCRETVTFDKKLRGSPGFTIL